MTEQLKAEAYVRKQRPALMELSFGCRVKYGTSYTTVWQVLLAENSKEQNHYNTVDVRGASNYLRDIQSSEIIGHPINLQDWLGVLWESNPNLEYTDAQMPLAKFGARAWYGLEKAPSDWIWFDAITGQPATQADYASFCAIMEL